MMSIRRVDLYIAKIFFVNFWLIALAFFVLIFFIDLLEIIDKIGDIKVGFATILLMALLHAPDFLNDIVSSIVLFAGLITFFSLSLRSEITILRSCGSSLWEIISTPAITAFLLGIFWVLIFDPLSIMMMRKCNSLEAKYIGQGAYLENINSGDGLWLKQANMEKNNEEIIVQAKIIYNLDFNFTNAEIWFFDKDGEFYKKLDAKKMQLKEGKWVLEDITLNDEKSLNQKISQYEISTNLKSEFVKDKIVSNFQNAKLFSVFELPKLIASLEASGFQSARFQVYFNSLLVKPILFVAMVLIACFFGINNFRDRFAIFVLLFGVICGLGLYILLTIINAFGSSRLIPVFASTWIIAFICFAIGVLLTYHKESVR